MVVSLFHSKFRELIKMNDLEFYNYVRLHSTEQSVNAFVNIYNVNGENVAIDRIYTVLISCLLEHAINESISVDDLFKKTQNENQRIDYLKSYIERQYFRGGKNELELFENIIEALPANFSDITWIPTVANYLRVLSESIKTANLIASTCVKWLNSLASMCRRVEHYHSEDEFDNGNQSLRLKMLETANTQTKFYQDLKDMCKDAVEIILNCLEYNTAAENVTKQLFPLLARKPFLLKINNFYLIFVKLIGLNNYIKRTTLALSCLNALACDEVPFSCQEDARKICTKKEVRNVLSDLAGGLAPEKLIKLALEVAINIQKTCPGKKLFKSSALQVIFIGSNLELRELAAKLLYYMVEDENDRTKFLEKCIDFYSANYKTIICKRRMIEACWQFGTFTNWKSFLNVIDRKKDDKLFVRNAVDLIIATIEIIPDQIEDQITQDDIIENFLKRLNVAFTCYLQDVRKNEYLLEKMIYILNVIKSPKCNSIVRLLYPALSIFCEHSSLYNSICLLHRLHEFDFEQLIKSFHRMFLRARRSIKTTTDLNHEAIINAYMRLSTFLEIGLSNNIDDLNTVVEFTSHDLFKQKWYEGEAQKSTLCAYNVIMLSGALKTLDQRNAYIDESQLVTLQQYLLDRLNNTTNSFGFINYAIFTSLCKLYMLFQDSTSVVNIMIDYLAEQLLLLKTYSKLLNDCKNLTFLKKMCVDFQQCLSHESNINPIKLMVTILQCSQFDSLADNFLSSISNGPQKTVFKSTVAHCLFEIPNLNEKEKFGKKIVNILLKQPISAHIHTQDILRNVLVHRRVLLLNHSLSRNKLCDINNSVQIAINMVEKENLKNIAGDLKDLIMEFVAARNLPNFPINRSSIK